MGGFPMMGGPSGMMTWMFWSSLIVNLIWLTLVGVAVWAFVRLVNTRSPGSASSGASAPLAGPSALEILQQRFARGEIDASTYATMRAQLEPAGVREPAPDGSGRGTAAASTLR